MNQNRSSVSTQTFAFFGKGVQEFSVEKKGVRDAEGQLYLTGSRGCLSMSGGGGGGSLLLLAVNECEDVDSQIFKILNSGQIQHVKSGLCLDVTINATSTTTTTNSPLVFNTCNSQDTTQRFRINDAPLYFEFPKLPGGPYRSYPWTGTGILLPLDPANNYKAQVLICGGSMNNQPPYISSNTVPAMRSCGLIDPETPNANWTTDTNIHMPTPRVLGDLLHLPDGTILNINGAKQGMAGWDLGRSPNLEAELFIPTSAITITGTTTAGTLSNPWQRLNSSNIPRMYHSSAMLLPDGRVIIAGSAPNSPTDKTYPAMYKTEHRVEYFHPPYLTSGLPRPVIDAASFLEGVVWIYNQVGTLHVRASPVGCPLEFSLIQPGFRTHSTGHGQRFVWLRKRGLKEGGAGAGGYKEGDYAVMSPPTAQIAPPGWYLLFALCNGVPSEAVWVQIGGDPAGIAEYYKS
jgi:hypothetical protein